MIHLIDAGNRHIYAREIVDLYRARKRVFVDELGWALPVREDGGESDQYDDDRAAQTVGFDGDGHVVMNVRIRPTDDGHMMLVHHFSHALWPDIGPVCGPDTWEVSRGLSLEAGFRRHDLRRKATCMLAALEVALAGGARRLVGLSDLPMFPFLLTMGWRVTFLGDPFSYGQGEAAAFQVEVSEDAVESMRAAWGLPDPSFVRLSPACVGDRAPLAVAEALADADPRWAELKPRQGAAIRPVALRLARRENKRALAQLDESRRALRDYARTAAG